MSGMTGTNFPYPVYFLLRMLRSFWGLPLVAIGCSVLLFAGLAILDRMGASAALAALGWPWDFTGKTALETVSTLAGLHTALFALYVSITLLVLTIAAGNLGVRLIDRWIDERVPRLTLAFFAAVLVFCVLLLFAVDPDGDSGRIPRGTIVALVLVTVLLIGWLCYAFHWLSRAIHVDTSIEKLGMDLERALLRLDNYRGAPINAHEDMPGRHIDSTRDGYVESMDCPEICKLAAQYDVLVVMHVSLGDFIMKGERLFTLYHPGAAAIETEAMFDCVTISGYRTDQQGIAFRAHLLAEIAARALSPAVNDLYTAMACTDYFAQAFGAFLKGTGVSGYFTDDTDTVRLIVPRLFPKSLIHAPLQVFRQVAAPYPAVALRLLDLLERIRSGAHDPEMTDYIKEEMAQIANDAIADTPSARDRAELARYQ